MHKQADLGLIQKSFQLLHSSTIPLLEISLYVAPIYHEEKCPKKKKRRNKVDLQTSRHFVDESLTDGRTGDRIANGKRQTGVSKQSLRVWIVTNSLDALSSTSY